MKTSLTLFSFLLLFALLTGCSALTGEEIGRIPINQVSTDDDDLIIKETTLDLKSGDEIAIWSDMDVEYEGDQVLRFKIEIVKGEEVIGGMEIDPMDKNITIGEIKTTFNGKTDWSFSGKNNEIMIEEDGKYTFRALLVASENPSLVINKAEIVLKK